MPSSGKIELDTHLLEAKLADFWLSTTSTFYDSCFYQMNLDATWINLDATKMNLDASKMQLRT